MRTYHDLYRDLFQKDIPSDLMINTGNFEKAIDLTLDNREKLVIKLYYLDNLNYEEIGRGMGLYRNRANQIANIARRKLRHPVSQQIIELGNIIEIDNPSEASLSQLAEYLYGKREISVRAFNSLYRYACYQNSRISVEIFLQLGISNLMKIRNIGIKQAKEIIDVFHKYGLKFSDE